MSNKYFISDYHVINLGKITRAEAIYEFGFIGDGNEIEQVDVHHHGCKIVLYGAEALNFWGAYKVFAKEKE